MPGERVVRGVVEQVADHEGFTEVSRPSRVVAVRLYVLLLLAAGVLFSVPTAMAEIPDVPWLSWDTSACYVLAVLLFAGELRSLTLVRHRGGDAAGVTISTTFAIALAVIGPVSLALLVQTVAVLFDDISRKSLSLLRVMFNTGQYLVTILATRTVFVLAGQHDFLGLRTGLTPRDVLPVLLAAATYFAVNELAVAEVLALTTGQPVAAILAEELRVQGPASAILLGLSPLAAIAADFSPFVLPLLILPLLGVEHNAWMASRRQHEAMHDGLTGLPNRKLLHSRAEELARRSGPHTFAVMLLDLDHFKEVNDTLGHHVGDGLLREIADRFRHAVPEGVMVARLGGDEFAVLVPDPTDPGAVRGLAEAIHGYLREPVVAEGVRIGVQASIGIALFPEHASSVDMVLRRADVALYRAKENRGETQVYRSEIDQHSVLRLSLSGDVHGGIDRGEFEAHFQPQVDARTGRVVAVEALLRWYHPTHGLISPGVFIPLAENNGSIVELSKVAARSALQTLSLLRGSGHELGAAVNIPARMLSDLELPAWINQMLITTDVPASCLTIEVTESAIMGDSRRAVRVLDELREMGVRISVDDFGTGYSSLSHLRAIRPDEVKIDQSFVQQMLHDEANAVIVRSTLELAHALGLCVVAEGVEDAETYAALRDEGCDVIQGFFVARPMNASTLLDWLAEPARREAGEGGPRTLTQGSGLQPAPMGGASV
jgi:diguanylate cyclase (GGDEF)-like protein